MAKLLSILLLMLIERVSCYCYSSTLYATTSTQYKSVSYYSNYDSCTFTISPSWSYSSSNYYLEIKWSSFDVKGDMPYCYDDYVEVSLTSNYKSIGKYCSNNLVSSGLFDMYSSDGYAKIKFKADGSYTGSGFRFSYRLRSKSGNYLGSYTSTYCSSTNSYANNGEVYSAGWPRSYARSSSSCTQKVYVGSSYRARVAIMDVNLNTGSYYCGSSYSDYVQLQGASSYSSSYPSSISSTLCSSSSIRAYTVSYYRYFYIKFNRYKGSQNSYRGFVAGYVLYNPNKYTPKSNTSTYDSSTAIIWSTIVSIAIFITILVVIIYRCKRRGSNGAIVTQNQAAATVLMTSNTSTTGTTTMPSTVNAHPSTVGYGAPNAYQQYPGSYAGQPAVSSQGYATSYPTANTYPTAATYPTNAAPPPYAPDMGKAPPGVVPGQVSTPQGNVAPPPPQPAFYPPPQQGDNQAPGMYPPGPLPDMPPPAYNQINSAPQ